MSVRRVFVLRLYGSCIRITYYAYTAPMLIYTNVDYAPTTGQHAVTFIQIRIEMQIQMQIQKLKALMSIYDKMSYKLYVSDF